MSHGRRYLDANSGLWNMVAGYDPPLGLAAASQGAINDRFPGLSHGFRAQPTTTEIAVGEARRGLALRAGPRVSTPTREGEANDSAGEMLCFSVLPRKPAPAQEDLTRINGLPGVRSFRPR